MLVGSYPPPYGGCSVHVERLCAALRDDYDVSVVDLYGSKKPTDEAWLTRCGPRRSLSGLRALTALRRAPVPVVHFHVAAAGAFLTMGYLMLAALRPGARKIITIHSGSFVSRFAHAPGWRRAMLRSLLRRFDRIVVVNDDQRRFLGRLGINPNKLAVVPAFLPPVATETPRVSAVFESLRGAERILIASGYGQPHYGFHLILDALDRLGSRAARTGVVFCTYNSYDESYIQQLSDRLSARRFSALLRDLTPGEFAWMLQRCDVYVRPTDRDGDAVALREALYYGKRAVASDCVTRPDGTVLFSTGNAEELAQKLSMQIGAAAQAAPATVDTLGALRNVYASVLTA